MRRRFLSSLFSLLLISTVSISQIAADNKIANLDEYFHTETITLPDGKQIYADTISGPPTPPTEVGREAVELPASDKQAGPGPVIALTVPAFDWYMGCSATSAAMIAAYWDRTGYPNMYTGPTDNGVMPMDNSSWGTWTDGDGGVYGQCPLTASRNGLDRRATRGSMDDYWVSYGSTAQDPFVATGGGEHPWGDAIADYMKTSQRAYGNSDGMTTFFTWNLSAGLLTCSDMIVNAIQAHDGTFGRKLFYEARGYTVTDCYNQKTDNMITGGFSFAQYQAEINAGRPVLINLAGHSVVGVGYNVTSGNYVFLHDTWDYSAHVMVWGGSYSGLVMRNVSIVNLAAPPTPPNAFGKTAPAGGAYATTSPKLAWGASSGATSYEYCFDNKNNNTCDTSWYSAAASTTTSLSGLTNNTTYYWQVRAVNGGGTTYADSGAWWSFTARNQTFADVPIDHPFWAEIDALYTSGITTGCGTDPLIYCPDTAVTRAAMAVFLLRAEHGSSYAPPAASHYFTDLPVAGKEWMEPWVDELYREGITGGCGTGPLIYCPETSMTRAAMAVFILRMMYGSGYTPPAASHYFADLPVAGKEWMEPWVDELYREGITSGCGTSPLIYCPEMAVKRQSMAAFIVRVFDLPLP
jgi:hypothetical protein